MFHGFGTFMVTPLLGTSVTGPMFEHHHGLWEAGTKQGLGLNYSDEGIFIGKTPPFYVIFFQFLFFIICLVVSQ